MQAFFDKKRKIYIFNPLLFKYTLFSNTKATEYTRNDILRYRSSVDFTQCINRFVYIKCRKILRKSGNIVSATIRLPAALG